MTAAVEPAPDEVAAAVTGDAGVARLSGGAFGEIASYLPGRRVVGVRVEDDRVEVHLVARAGVVLPELADRLAALLAPVIGRRVLEVVVEDIEPAAAA